MPTSYASFRQQPLALTAVAASGGNLTTTATKFYSLQYRNRSGYNTPSTPVSVSHVAGQKVQITITASQREEGEDIFWFVISCGDTSDVSTHKQIAIYFGLDPVDQVTERTLPFTLELTEDDHLLTEGSVATPANLPSGASLIQGMLRGVDSLSSIFYYDSESILTASSTVLDAAPDPGRWIKQGSFSTYQASSLDTGGSDVLVENVNEASLIKPPVYPGTGIASVPVKLWWFDSRVAGQGQTPQGLRFGFAFDIEGVSSSALLDENVEVTLDGYVNLATGELDTEGIDTTTKTYRYGKIGGQIIDKAIPSGFAAQWSVALILDVKTLQFPIPRGSQFRVRIFLFPLSGVPNPLYGFTGDVIFPDTEKRRIVAGASLSALALEGSGSVKRFIFSTANQTIPGLQANTALQAVSINGDGVCILEGVSPVLDSTVVLRANIGTLSGLGASGTQGQYIAIAGNSAIRITVNHPVSNERGVVRANYPDVIKGNALGTFNPPLMRVYLQRESDGEIREFTGNAPVLNATQEIDITSWASGVVVGALPTADADFGLYQSDAPLVAQIGGSTDLIATNYRASIAYEYNGNQVTTIDHSVGVIEFPSTLSNIAFTNQFQTYSKAQIGTPETLSINNGSVTIDCESANTFVLVLSENVTISIVNISPSTNFDLLIIQDDSVAYDVTTWPNLINWISGNQPSISATLESRNIFSFKSFDGTTLDGTKA